MLSREGSTTAEAVGRTARARPRTTWRVCLVAPLLYAPSVDTLAEPLLRFSPPRAGAPLDTPVGRGWRHDFDLVLTRDGDALVVRDADGARHVLERPIPPIAVGATGALESGGTVRYASADGAGGHLDFVGGTYRWSADDGRRVTFAGSLPIRIDHPDGTTRTLRYANGRLTEVTSEDGATLRLHHRGGRLRGATMPDGTRLSLALDPDGTLLTERHDGSGVCRPGVGGGSEGATTSDEDDAPPGTPPDTSPGSSPDVPSDASRDEASVEDTPADEAPDDGRCDRDANPPDPAFVSGPGIPGGLRLDVRPTSCDSHFVERRGTARGTAIERDLATDAHYAGYAPTVRSFPIVDFVGAELRVVRSRDLALPGLDAVPDGLLERLLRDGREIESLLIDPLERDGLIAVREGTRTTRLPHRPGRPIVLELVVRHGLASADQIGQIARARRLLSARHGIALRVIEIP